MLSFTLADWVNHDSIDELIIVRPYDDSGIGGIGNHLNHDSNKGGGGGFPCKTTQIALCYRDHNIYKEIPFRLVVTDQLGNELPAVGANGVWTIIELGNVTEFIINIYE